MVLTCPRPVDVSGRTAEAKRTLSTGSGDYLVYAYVSAFRPGAAATFMSSWRATAGECGQESSVVDPPTPITPPPGADDAVRITSSGYDAIWVRRGDYVAEVRLYFNRGVDPAVAPDLATRAVAKIAANT